MSESLRQYVTVTSLPPDEIPARAARIYRELTSSSPYVTQGNFTRIHSQDLRFLFDAYDRLFFQGLCRPALAGSKLNFRISRRMTSAGGHTVRYTPRLGTGTTRYEIAVSSTLLFQAFSDPSQRSIFVSGRPCQDRLEALQRILEHELVHLVETVCWGSSSCSGPRFQSIALRLFGHTEHTHQLVTPREHAFVKFQVRPGARVRFQLDGQTHVGVVNRITKRATVLVAHPQGVLYSDGKRYAKFYIPVSMLEVVADKAGGAADGN